MDLKELGLPTKNVPNVLRPIGFGEKKQMDFFAGQFPKRANFGSCDGRCDGAAPASASTTS